MFGYTARVLLYCTLAGEIDWRPQNGSVSATPVAAPRAECAPGAGERPHVSASPPARQHDFTIVRALELLWLPRHKWPRVELFLPGRFPGLEGQLAFRLWNGRCLDPTIYVNPRHRLYTEAVAAGSDPYPYYRLASVLIHEMAHGEPDSSEAAALAAQAAYLRRVLPFIPVERRGSARAYIRTIETRMFQLTRGRAAEGAVARDRE